ncbi:MAG: hypothetical protein JWO62_2567 [Acidimicrobiaceae bacterium]|nr:hypothetical protein [Acidimicrobiaceae bacterium]
MSDLTNPPVAAEAPAEPAAAVAAPSEPAAATPTPTTSPVGDGPAAPADGSVSAEPVDVPAVRPEVAVQARAGLWCATCSQRIEEVGPDAEGTLIALPCGHPITS